MGKRMSSRYKSISVFLIFTFLFLISELPLHSQMSEGQQRVEDGIEKYKNAYFEEAINLLKSALNYSLSKEIKIQAYVYLSLSELALGRREDAKGYFREIVKLDPDYYLGEIEYPEEVRNLYKEARGEVSIIEEFSVRPTSFRPYLEKAIVDYSLSSYGDVKFRIKETNGYYQRDRYRDKNNNSIRDTFYWNGRDNSGAFLQSGRYEYILETENKKSGDTYLRQKLIGITLIAPYGTELKEEISPTEPRGVLKSTFEKICFLTGIVVVLIGALNAEKELENNPEKNTATQSLTIAGVGFGITIIPGMIGHSIRKSQYKKDMKKYAENKKYNSKIKENVVIKQKEIKD